MTFAVSAAAHVFITHSSVFTASATTSCDVAAVKDAFADDVVGGIEPVAAAGAHRAARGAEAAPAAGAEPAPDLSSLALELSRRAVEASVDVPCTLTVPPPLSH